MRQISYTVILGICLMVLGWVVSVILPSKYVWQIGIATLLVFVIVSYLLNRENIKSTRDKLNKKEEIKKQAQELLSNWMGLEKKLWSAKAKLPEATDPFIYKEIQGIIADMMVVRNNLSVLIKDSSDFDKTFTALWSIYNRFIEFHMNPYDETGTTFINQAHKKLRWYIEHNLKY